MDDTRMIPQEESLIHTKRTWFGKLVQLYREGFKTMTWGKPLWILNIIKLLIMFGVLRLFFFPNFLKEQADTEEGRREYVRQELINRAVDSGAAADAVSLTDDK